MGIHIILACDAKYGIAKNGQIPWKLKEEMAYFKQITLGTDQSKTNGLIMGRKTWESLPRKPLPKRHHIILSSSAETSNNEMVTWKSSIEDALFWYCEKGEFKIHDLFVIGGESIYHQCMTDWIDLIDSIYITLIDQDYQCDQFFSWKTEDIISLGFVLETETIDHIDNIRIQYLRFIKPPRKININNSV